ncbi:invasion associated locus B family protein [Alteromonas sp. ASW11-130]|uniref:invasion associated locus B family protein n=1 Tax=Alteromonas sp. ASW11-130 TaxID=3015775 RepID=UPI002241A857|nr:invasion associated locus B family protein [Alteromonas sp. ASW11-130]MCW8090949.1 invasion associated locus B family protein [Alteromonas sp. ASW11-130]
MCREVILKLCLTVLTIAMGITAAAAQTHSQKQDWTVVCDDECVATQQLENPKNKLKFTAVISAIKNNNQVVLRVIFPLGVYLPPGIAFKIGEYEQTHPMTVCMKNGCSVMAPLTDELEKHMRAQDTLLIRYFSTQDQENEISLSMKGIANTLDMLK